MHRVRQSVTSVEISAYYNPQCKKLQLAIFAKQQLVMALIPKPRRLVGGSAGS
jgi:hypothetical protein